MTGITFRIAELCRQLIQVDFSQQFLNRFSAHFCLEIVFVFFVVIAVLFFGQGLFFGEGCIARFRDDIEREVQDAFQHLRRDIQNQAHPRRNAAEIPDVRDRRSQLDVTHPFTANGFLCHFDAAAFADLSFETNFFIFTAMAFPVFCWSENPFAEQTVYFRLQ